jgi:hypothetical protein
VRGITKTPPLAQQELDLCFPPPYFLNTKVAHFLYFIFNYKKYDIFFIRHPLIIKLCKWAFWINKPKLNFIDFEKDKVFLGKLFPKSLRHELIQEVEKFYQPKFRVQLND